jgi:hypothetical protein
MTKHTDHHHPNTPAARAACRRRALVGTQEANRNARFLVMVQDLLDGPDDIDATAWVRDAASQAGFGWLANALTDYLAQPTADLDTLTFIRDSLKG